MPDCSPKKISPPSLAGWLDFAGELPADEIQQHHRHYADAKIQFPWGSGFGVGVA
jgi:hypothetical protein